MTFSIQCISDKQSPASLAAAKEEDDEIDVIEAPTIINPAALATFQKTLESQFPKPEGLSDRISSMNEKIYTIKKDIPFYIKKPQYIFSHSNTNQTNDNHYNYIKNSEIIFYC